MEDELVLLTSYFNLVGGRRQDTADTFRVDTDLPSASSPDGTAALYILTESSTGGHMGPRARRLVADTVAWEYSSHADDQPVARLKAALYAAHTGLLREFDGHVAVGASVIAVERDVIYLAQVAPAQVYVMHEDSLHSLPATADGSSPFSRALGSRVEPTISVFRDQVEAGDVVALCSTWFDRTADAADVRECFAGGTADDIAEALLELAKAHDVLDVTAIVIEAASSHELAARGDEDRPAGLMEQIDVAVQALAGVGRMLLTELRPAPLGSPEETNGSVADAAEKQTAPGAHGAHSITSEQPLVEPRAVPEADAETGEHPIVTPNLSQTTESPVIDAAALDWPAPGVESVDDGQVAETHAEPSLSEGITEEIPAVTAPPPRHPPTRERKPEPMSELEQVNSRLGDTQDMSDVIPPVQAFEEAASTEPHRIYATKDKDIDAVNRRPRRFGGAAPVIRPGLDIDLRKPVSRAAPPALIWGGVAAFLVLAVAAGILYFSGHHTTHTNPYPAAVAQDLRRAKTAKTPSQQDSFLNKASKDINLAAQNGSTATSVAAMRARLRTTGDTLHHITRVASPVLITDFSKFPSAAPSQIASVPGSVYVLDPGRKSVFSVTAQPNQNPTQVAVSGDQFSGFTLGTPQLLATSGTTAYVLDSNNVLLRDAAGTKTATSLASSTQSSTPKYASMYATPDGTVFLLDPTSDQVWRFSNGAPPPATYWDSNPPTLKDAVSIAFDNSYLYILKSSGGVLKYDLANVPQPHQFTTNLKIPPSHPATIYTDAAQKYVWIADPVHGRILQLDKDGTYVRTYLSSGPMDLSKMKGMTVGPAGNTIYVMAGSKLYDFPVVP